MNIFLILLSSDFKNALIKISLLHTEHGLNHQAVAIANKRKELTLNEFVGVCVIQKEITGNIPASNGGPLVLILYELFFQAFFFFFPAVVRIFMESSKKFCLVLFLENTNWFDFCFFLWEYVV